MIYIMQFTYVYTCFVHEDEIRMVLILCLIWCIEVICYFNSETRRVNLKYGEQR